MKDSSSYDVFCWYKLKSPLPEVAHIGSQYCPSLTTSKYGLDKDSLVKQETCNAVIFTIPSWYSKEAVHRGQRTYQ